MVDPERSVAAEATARRPRRRWVERARMVLGLALLVAIAVFLYRRGDVLAGLPSLSAATWALLVAVSATIALTSVRAVQRLQDAVGARLGFGETFLLHNAAFLLNLLPAKAGTVLRASYLKRHHGFSFARFGVFAVALTLLTVLVSSLIGLVSLLAVYGLSTTASRWCAALLAACVTFALLLLVVPLPPLRWPGRLGEALHEFIVSRGELRGQPRLLLAPAGWLICGYLLGSLRIGIVYAGLGLDAHPGGLLLLGALGQVSILANLTPGGLGVRELLVGGGAVVLGVPVEAGLLAAVIERAIGLAWSVLVGIPSAVWVWRRKA